MEEVASRMVSDLRSRFVDKDVGGSALALARCYVTRRCGDLEPSMQDFARAAATDTFPGPNVRCLTLLATAGDEQAWNDRRSSVSHKAIPLPSVEALRRSPMVARLVQQLGLDPQQVVDPDPSLFPGLSERSYNVFFVAEARDSPYVPAQDTFVIPYGVRSVVGFGGMLPDGTLFAVVLFSTVPIPTAAVEAFASVALSAKVAFLPQLGGRVFADDRAPTRTPQAQAALERMVLEAQNNTLTQLLDMRASFVEDEASRLEQVVADAEERATAFAASRSALEASEAQKSAILDGALDCVIGMDSTGRITEFNRAAEATFGYRRDEAIGTVLGEIMVPYGMRERHRLGLAKVLATGDGPILGRRIEVNALRRDGIEFPVELTVTRVANTNPPVFSGYVRDITTARQAAADVAASRERLAHIARTLQTSLLPPHLPDIHGVELAAAFTPFGDGYDVGGDFYDAFELSDDRWALSLGDVCGKGSEAAAVTALARYTLRAAAMRRGDPAAVLETLNYAIHRQDTDRFCTVVYASLDPATGTVIFALGGHPHPLLLTAAGHVHALGTTSPLLGPYATWRGTTHTVTLEPGDTLLLYSDGVTEARGSDELFGDDRLAATLRTAAGLHAADVVELIETTVVDFAGRLTDDLAILAVRRPNGIV